MHPKEKVFKTQTAAAAKLRAVALSSMAKKKRPKPKKLDAVYTSTKERYKAIDMPFKVRIAKITWNCRAHLLKRPVKTVLQT